jgi:hypothetical protein
MSRTNQTLEDIRGTKVKIELIKEKATTIEEELKAVSLTLTEFEAVQTGGKRQEAMRKEIYRMRKLQTQRKAEIESLEVCAFCVFFRVKSSFCLFSPTSCFIVASMTLPHFQGPNQRG